MTIATFFALGVYNELSSVSELLATIGGLTVMALAMLLGVAFGRMFQKIFR